MVFPSVALAVARCAIDEVTDLAHGKTPLTSTTMLWERASAQAQLAHAEALWRAGRVLLYETLRTAWDVSVAGETLTLHQKADLLLAMTQAVSGAATAVEWMWSAAGTSGIFRSSPLERYFRDMQVLKQQDIILRSGPWYIAYPMSPHHVEERFGHNFSCEVICGMISLCDSGRREGESR